MAFAFAPVHDVLPEWVTKLFARVGVDFDQIGLTAFDVIDDGQSSLMTGTVAWLKEIELAIPELEMVSLVLLQKDEADMTTVGFVYEGTPDRLIGFTNLAAALRIQIPFLHRVEKDADGKWAPALDDQGQPLPVDIVLGGVDVDIDGDRNVSFPSTPSLALPAIELGSTGIVIELDEVELHLSAKQTPPAGAPSGFKGVHIKKATLHFSRDFGISLPQAITVEDLLIGSSGFSGHITAAWAPAVKGSLFGIGFELASIDLTFTQNVPTGGGIKGKIELPFFDVWAGVDLSYDAEGGLSVVLSGTDGDDLLHYTKPGVLSISVDSLGFTLDDGDFAILLSGQLTPDVGGLSWPTFDVKELSIDSEGRVKLAGGWLDLPSQYSLDLNGFTVEITKLGFGKTDDGGKWVGFSGGLRLVEGLSAGASVEGLRVTWYPNGDTNLTLEGASVEFEVPDVLRFKGEVSMRTFKEGNETIRRFDGSIALELVSLGLTIDGTLVIGSVKRDDGTRYRFFALYVDAQLPVGIPLGSTGVSFYGFAGLFANNMEPGRKPAEPWYSLGTNDWYHRDEVGVTNLAKKWTNQQGSIAFGAGVCIGTGSDNGFTFAGKVLLVIVFPGPIIMLEGTANLLKERAKLADEGMFRSLAVIDCRANTFLFGLDARFKTGDGGELLDLKVGAEAFFDFDDPLAWHIYLGEKEPRDRRIRASVFRIFEANSYLMIDAHKLQTGAWVGFGRSWSFGPVGLTIEAWIEGNAVISWKPAHFYGDLWLHGSVAIRVFRFRLGLTVDARISADVFEPFKVRAEIAVSIDLPRPFKSRSVNAVIQWGPKLIPPPMPLPLQEVAMEHLLATTTWPLARAENLLDPDYNQAGRPGYIGTPVPSTASRTAPIVPVDARPRLTFARPVHDDAKVGVNLQPVVPAREVIGDPTSASTPYSARYGLKRLELSKDSGSGATPVWTPVASAPQTGNLPALYGSWAPVPAVPDGGGPNLGQVKLWLWSKTPFDYTRNTSREWDEWFTDKYTGYPCIPAAPDRNVCVDFEAAPLGPVRGTSWTWPGHEGLAVIWTKDFTAQVVVLATPVGTLTRALCHAPVPPPAGEPPRPGKVAPAVEIRTEIPARRITVVVAWPSGPPTLECADFRREKTGTGPNPRTHGGVVFTASGTRPPANTSIASITTPAGPLAGLAVGLAMSADLPRDSDVVEIMVTAVDASVTALDASNAVVASAPATGGPSAPTTVRLQGPKIRRVIVTTGGRAAFIHQVCFAGAPSRPRIEANAFDAKGRRTGPFPVDGARIDVKGPDISRVVVQGDRPFCLVQICFDLGPDPLEVAARQDMESHASAELARWAQVGDVLEPHTSYRLEVETTVNDTGGADRTQVEHAFFRTGGPPGIGAYSRPSGVPSGAVFATGLEDLSRYVRQTIPATLAAPGQKPPLPRPVYRAYDVGVEFNQDYVDLMYRLDGRDLALHLYDANNRPVRDARGRLVSLSNNWGVTEQLTLSESDSRWITVLNGSDCRSVNTEEIPHQVTIGASSEGHVLDPDIVYEARLVPLLLHEVWSAVPVGTTATGPFAPFGGWQIVDLAPTAGAAGPSAWTVAAGSGSDEHVVRQTTAIAGGDVAGTSPDKPGTVLLVADRSALTPPAEQPDAWADYRLTVNVRSGTDGAIGVVIRYLDAANYYRFSMDRGRRRRQLVRVANGVATVLAEDDEPYRKGFDYVVTVAAIGTSIEVQVDGDPVFQVDETLNGVPVAGVPTHGRPGLYSWANNDAQFADVRVDDFRDAAPVAYRFKFTTSNFATFAHHLHSFRDESWPVARDATQMPDAAVMAAANAAVAVAGFATPPADAEVRAYAAFLASTLGPDADQDPPAVEVTRVERAGGDTLALIVRGPEPIDYRRSGLGVGLAPAAEPGPAGLGVGDLKLISASFAADATGEESSTALLLRDTDLTGWRLEQRRMDGLPQSPAGTVAFRDDRHRRDDGDTSRVGPWTVVDLGGGVAAGGWRIAGDTVVGAALGGESAVVTSGSAWGDFRYTVRFHSDGAGAVGVVFRYVDADNHYRLTFAATAPRRRLERIVGGVATLLWSDATAVPAEATVTVQIEVAGDRLQGSVDGTAAFDLTDTLLATGAVGLYVAGTDGARFEQAEVRRCARWHDRFAASATQGWALAGPGTWSAASGVLVHAGPAPGGATAVSGDPAWSDVMVTADIRADSGGAGLLFRCADGANAYRFVLSGASGGARLVKVSGGTEMVLWAGPTSAAPSSGYRRVTVIAEAAALRGFVDGIPAFATVDDARPAGRIGLWATGEARFTNVQVDVLSETSSSWLLDEPFDAVPSGRWLVLDEGVATGPSGWVFGDGELRQTSLIGDPAPPTRRAGRENPDLKGTEAVAGDRTWSDYRLTVSLASGASGAVGVVFRFADQDNCYRLAMDKATPYRRLVKKVGGKLTTLWQDQTPLGPGERLITIDCDGSQLTGYVDGVRLFRVQDDSIPAGQVGLYTWANSEAHFREVRVAPRSWAPMFDFGPEEPLAAGTQVHIRASGAGSAGSAAAGPHNRRADLRDVGFDPGGVRLRAVAPNGTVSHERTFLPPDAFAPADLRVLRKADGTGFVLIPPPSGGAPGRLRSGSYRLSLPYRRENRAADPTSQVFKQAGDSDPEEAVLDVPWTIRP